MPDPDSLSQTPYDAESGRRNLSIIDLVATVTVAVLVTRLARRALDRELEAS